MRFTTRIRYWWVLLPPLAMLSLTYWLNEQVKPEPIKTDTTKRHDPDAVMENFSATKLNEQGTPHFVLNAKKLQHYPDDDTTLLEVPRVVSLSADKASLHIIAKRGTVANQGNEVFLYDDIELLREAYGNQAELRMQTNFLHILPDQDLVKTDQPVMIANGPSTTRAIGLELDNKTRTLTLLSQVRSEYVPKRP